MTNLIMEKERGRVKIGKVRTLFLRWYRMAKKVEEEHVPQGIFIGENTKVRASIVNFID
jgi:hypothetical protein